MRFRPITCLAAMMLSITGGVALIASTPAAAVTLTVTNCNDSGTGSLRQTVADASSGDTINFAMSPPCSTIDDSTGAIPILKSLTIVGPTSALAVDGMNESQIFEVVGGGTLNISRLTIEDGEGGGIYNNGTLTVTNSTLSGNSGPDGGGIFNGSGTVTINSSTLSGNGSEMVLPGGGSSVALGGAIYNSSGSVTINSSTLSGNLGGAIYSGGTVAINNSTLSGNTLGSAIDNNGGTVTINSSTLSGNSSPDEGAVIDEGFSTGIYGATVTINNSTLSGNSGGAILAEPHEVVNINNSTLANNLGFGISTATSMLEGPQVRLKATLLSNNQDDNCLGPAENLGIFVDNGYNLDDDSSCMFDSSSISDFKTLSTTLGPLANNGGPTQTIALLPGNPGIDHVPDADCPATDQRGDARTAPCDIGAYDTDNGSTGQAPVITSANASTATVGRSFSFQVIGTGLPTPTYSESGTLPAGITFSTSGLFSGIPMVGTQRSYPVTITSSNGVGRAARQDFTLTVISIPTTTTTTSPPATTSPPPATSPRFEQGYELVASDGGIFNFGKAQFDGSMGGGSLRQPVVGMATDVRTGGYWEVASDGGIFSFNAPFYGSMGGTSLNAPIVGMTSDNLTGGYWMVGSDGGVFAFNAPFYGSMGGTRLNQPIVGMAAMPFGTGYWLVASDGGVFAFGNAPFLGSVGGSPSQRACRRHGRQSLREWLLARRIRRWPVCFR